MKPTDFSRDFGTGKLREKAEVVMGSGVSSLAPLRPH